MNAKPGDKVRFRLAKKEVDGVLLESYDPTVYLIKLESGYNIGISKEGVQETRILKKNEVSDKKFELPKPKKGLRTIGMVVTGGTIASKLDSSTGGVKALTDVGEFAYYYPELFESVNVKKIEVPFTEMSENMNSDHWVQMAESVSKLLNDPEIEGVVLTHGTDFLHYTAAMLSFFLKNLNKPVVLTYSQKSIDRGSSDARLNLLCAAHMATSECAEVMLVGHENSNDDYCLALRGTKCRKMHTSKRGAFEAINTKPIAKVTKTTITYLDDYNLRDDSKKVEVDGAFSEKVALVKFYPGQKPDILDYYKEKGYYGAVIEVAGIGHLPALNAKNSWIPTIKRLTKEGFVICGAAQTLNGRLHPKVYSVGREIEKAGVIFLSDMLAETAYVKLGWIMGHRTWRTHDKVKEKILSNISGEISKNLYE